MHRIVLLLAVCLLVLPSPALAAEPPPNVILIVLDDFGWKDLGCYGSTFYRTPHVDRLSQEGLRFTDAYAACPVCSPTRAAIMTGKYPARLQLTDWLPGRRDMPSQQLLRPDFRQQLPLEETTLAEALAARGYVCANIGKWHLGGAGFLPEQQGFALNIAGDAAGSPLSYFAPYRRGDRVMPGLEQAPEGEYLTDRLFDAADGFIRQERQRPFFLYLPHFAVHIPLQARQELVSQYAGRGGKEPPRGQQDNAIYAAMIQSVDEGIGRLRQTLADCELTDRTLILFTSDNGGLVTLEGPHTPATSNAPLREGKGYLYEGGIRVPLILHGPGLVPSGETCAVPVSSIDLLPTILELCGAPLPATDGQSLVPLWKNPADFQREALYWHYPHYSNQGGRPGGAIREGRYKLIEFYEQQRRELFDLERDLREANNLSEQLPEVVARLSRKLQDWRTAVGAQMPRPNPDFVPNPQAEDGTVHLHARTAEVHGVMLRYEPQPHKNTLGYWTRQEDWAHWDFQLQRPGTFRIQILQGCGNGSGGSRVLFKIGDHELPFDVQETGGFQQFVERELGEVTLPQPGRYQLEVRPQSKPGPAVMDLRSVKLVPGK